MISNTDTETENNKSEEYTKPLPVWMNIPPNEPWTNMHHRPLSISLLKQNVATTIKSLDNLDIWRNESIQYELSVVIFLCGLLFCLHVIVKSTHGLKFLKIMSFEVTAENALFLCNFNTQRCLTLLKTFKATFYSTFTKIISCDDK